MFRERGCMVIMKADCDICMYYAYDEEYECMVCTAHFDEDEVYAFKTGRDKSCPYFRRGDDYTIVKKQI